MSEILKNSFTLKPIYLKVFFAAISLKILLIDFFYIERLTKKNIKPSHIIGDIIKIIIVVIALMFTLRIVFNVNLARILTPYAILTAIIGLSNIGAAYGVSPLKENQPSEM